MTSAVTKMADVLNSQKNTNHGLEKLTVPNWDGSRKNYATWKSLKLLDGKVQTGWESTNRTKTSNYKDCGKRCQKIRFGQIKLGLEKRSIRHGKFWTSNSETRENYWMSC